jgi:hypothetical protein
LLGIKLAQGGDHGRVTPEEQLAVAFALKKVKIPGFRKALAEEGRFTIAQTIVEHLKLC